MSIKALKRENLQLAVFTPFNIILANNKFPLSGALSLNHQCLKCVETSPKEFASGSAET